jgi:hypothetical protein
MSSKINIELDSKVLDAYGIKSAIIFGLIDKVNEAGVRELDSCRDFMSLWGMDESWQKDFEALKNSGRIFYPDEACSFWRPSNATVATLRQFGLKPQEITKLNREYVLRCEYKLEKIEEKNFVAFATKKLVKKDSNIWEPSLETIEKLMALGVPEEFTKNKISEFKIIWKESDKTGGVDTNFTRWVLSQFKYKSAAK